MRENVIGGAKKYREKTERIPRISPEYRQNTERIQWSYSENTEPR